MVELKRENFIAIFGFMVKDLQLKGLELMTYAIIYGFSQDNDSEFAGSLSYLMAWTGATKPTAIKVLKSLVDKDLIEKKTYTINGVTFNKYKAKTTNLTTGCETLPGVKKFNQGGKKILPNNIDNNIVNLEIDKSISLSSDIPCEEIFKMYNEICTNLPKANVLNQTRKKVIKSRWNDEANKDIEKFRQVFNAANVNPFMCGQNNRNWKANFDYCISPKGFTQLLEGSAIGTDTPAATGKSFYDLWQERMKEVKNGNTET